MVLDCVLRPVEKRVPNVGLVLKRGSTSRTRSTNALTLFDFNYADDIAFMAHSTADAQRLLQALQTEAAACGLQTKAGEEKTSYMLFAGCVDQCITDVNGVKIPHVKKYRYLGRIFAEGDKNMNEMAIESRVKAAWTELDVYDYVWKQTNIFMSTKNLLFNAIVSSKLMFSCGSWMPSAAQMHALDTTFLSMKRYALKIPFRNNAGVRVHRAAIMGKDIFPSSMIIQAQLRLIGHATRHHTPLLAVCLWRPQTVFKRFRTFLTSASQYTRRDEDYLLQETTSRTAWQSIVQRAVEENESRIYGTSPSTHTPTFAHFDDTRSTLDIWKQFPTPFERQFCEEGMIPHFFDPEWVNAYTDGSQKDGVSGAAVHFPANQFADIVATVPPKPINDRSAGLETNNRAELWAALQALRRGSLVKLALHVDSQLTWQFLLSSVYSHWINDYKGLENRDLLRKISKLVFARREPMLIFKVRSHNGNPHNEKVDQLADEARALQIGR